MSDHIPGPGKMVSARDEAVERALMAAWCNPPESKTDAEAFISALADAGYAVVPVKPSIRMCAAGGPEVRKACGLDKGKGDMHTIWAAMLAAAGETHA
jgi:hypothetical protein